MDTDRTNGESRLVDAPLTDKVIGVFYDVYNELGSGFLESVYENAFCIALRDAGLEVAQQVPLDVRFRRSIVEQFRVDLLVASRLVVEVKAVSQIVKAHETQLVNYLKATGYNVGLLVNFGQRPQFKRRIFNMSYPCSSALIRVEKNVR
ncbi:MAG: GxxExxY protein [Rhodanobacteraceae bacterium]|nr:MAG: GxxExxY protein [Rhodanobacteraceae bacterium]